MRIKNEIIERVVKQSNQEPLLTLRLNFKLLSKIDFGQIFKQADGEINEKELFKRLQSMLSQKIDISHYKMLYKLGYYNSAAEAFLSETLGLKTT